MVLCYSQPTRCPVLTWRSVVSTSCALSGTGIAYVGSSLRASYAMSGGADTCALFCEWMATYLGIGLRACYAMSGTDLACARLSAYGQPTRCPVLTKHMVANLEAKGEANSGMLLRASYAMSGTDLAYSATATCPRAPLYCYWYLPTRFLSISGTDLAYGNTAICLRTSYAISGTDVAYGATRRVCRDHVSAAPLCKRGGVVYGAIFFRVCYALSGTEIAYRAIWLRARYAMCGTEVAFQGKQEWEELRGNIPGISLRASYAMSGYALPMRCAVLTYVLCDVRCVLLLNAMCGTELAYGAIRGCTALVR
eukprot:2409567-Rhodomonas_salina.3